MSSPYANVPGSDYDFLLKIIFVGDSGVGKSALLKSFMGEEFTKHYVSTIGVDFEIKQTVMNNKKVHLQIWDTAGQERFRTITTSYYRSSDAILLVFDVSDANSFKNLATWLDNAREYARKDVAMMLIGNKADLQSERAVDYKTAKQFADDNFLPYLETSAKTVTNVEQAFNTVSITALQQKMAEKDRMEVSKDDRIGLNANNESSPQKKSGCC